MADSRYGQDASRILENREWEEGERDHTPRPVLINCRPVNKESRVGCAMHHSLDASEPLWLMIPVSPELAAELESVVLVTKTEEIYDIDIDLSS